QNHPPQIHGEPPLEIASAENGFGWPAFRRRAVTAAALKGSSPVALRRDVSLPHRHPRTAPSWSPAIMAAPVAAI
ncbi:hypothetical protein, partial [Microvirga pakistanensis]|uniref:hypothetical protein n=1 Tax=Microvirga pakistanensis TaxID=1682650 RepID=UPI00195A715F